MSTSDASLSSRFSEFLGSFKLPNGEVKYRGEASRMVATGSTALLVDFADISSFDPDLAAELVKEPDRVLEAFRRSCYDLLAAENAVYASLVRKDIRIRFGGVDNRVSLRGLGKERLNKMVLVFGTIVRSSSVEARMVKAAYECPSGHSNFLDVEGEDDALLKKPLLCEACDEKFRFELLPRKSEFVDYQVMRIQESPEELPPGQIPAYFDVMFTGDLVNVVRPGDRVAVTGILRAVPNAFRKSKIYDYRLECNYAEALGKEPEVSLSKEDEERLRAIAASESAYQRLVASVAPTILGHEREKEAILLLLAGAPAFRTPDGTRLRGDINTLFVGDPGISKSMLLKFAAGIAPRGMYASGRGSSAAGLSAAVVKEKDSYTLEIGAAVLADQGILCVEEGTELYTGDSLTKVEDLWAKGEPIKTPMGVEERTLRLPIASYDGKRRTDITTVAPRITRRRYSGEVTELTFSSGLRLGLTPEHLVRRNTIEKNLWIEAGKLRPGDEVKSPKSLFGPILTYRMDAATAYILGFIYGDGWISDNHQGSITITQSKNNMDIIDRIRSISPFKFSLYLKKEQERKVRGYTLTEKPAVLWTSDTRLVALALKTLRPSIDAVLSLDDEALAAFLAGVLDSDGDVNHSRGTTVAMRLYPTRNEHELAVLIHALRRFSIRASIRRDVHHKQIPIIQMTGEDISKFLRVVRPFSVKANRAPNRPVKHKRKRLPYGVEKVVDVRIVNYDGYVYDLVVPSHHNFAAGLVYIHNCVDELDKMRPEDRSAMHEVMEQGTVTISKAGINATLNARTSVLAAMNPTNGIYNPYESFSENVNLPPALLSRMDLIFVMRDYVNEEADRGLAKHILILRDTGDYPTAPPVDPQTLKKYLLLCKKVRPKTTPSVRSKLEEFYVALRRLASMEGGIGATPRTLEALIRLSQAHARLLLRDEVQDDDAQAAIDLMEVMFNQILTDPKTGKKLDFGQTEGKTAREMGMFDTAVAVVKELGGAENNPFPRQELRDALMKTGKFGSQEEADKMLKRLFAEGIIYEPRPGFFKRVGN